MLGEGLVRLHQTAWAQGHVAGSELAEIDSAVFYRELFEAATECSRMSYANVLRNKAHKSIDRAHAERLTTTTGHTMTALGRLTAVIGGWRPSAHVEGCCLHAFFVDVLGLRLVEPTLHAQSASPQSRIRHAACAIQRPRWVPRGEDEPEMPCVLVLGGCASPPDGSREPIAHGLLSLCVLSVCEENGSLVRWHKAEAVGTAPRGIWHHDCGSYNRGSKVVVFGGDMQESDPEYEHIRERSAAAHVYVLDVEKREWARVQTSGHHPAWRSLHVCATHKSLVDDSEQLLVLGGSDEHVALFSGGDPAPLHAYALDLGSMSWRAAPHGSFTPMPRLRFAAERWGTHLICYGGHSLTRIPESERVVRLDLRTLHWQKLELTNKPFSHPDTPASRLAGGILVGGIQVSAWVGVTLVPKLEVLVLDAPHNSARALAGTRLHWEGPAERPPEEGEETCAVS